MNLIFKTVLSMSLSGALFISALLFVGRLLKGKLGRQWQYYVWLIVVLRLLIPFGPEASLMGQVHRVADRVTADSDTGLVESMPAASQGTAAQDKNHNAAWAGGFSFSKALNLAEKYLWVIWLAVALHMLTRKISMYQSYIRQVTAGAEPVCDTVLLDRLAVMEERAGIGGPIELCVNPQVSSPMLVGYRHPCIVLPDGDVPEKDFRYIVMHELTHYKRRDIWYKWLVQLTVCLHWFNPLVHVMGREIDRACEFSCDEAVVGKMGYDHAKEYGETLLDAMASAGICREPFAAVTMSADKELLRERLGAIMSCKKRTKRTGIITAGLTAGIILGAVFLGVYPTAADAWENEVFPREMIVNMPVCRIRAGAGETYQVVELVGEGESVAVLGKKEGIDGKLWYLLDQESLPEPPDPAAEECYIRADLVE